MECKLLYCVHFRLSMILIRFVFFFSCQSVQNLGLAVVSMFAGIIVDRGGYFTLEIFFICWLGGEFSI